MIGNETFVGNPVNLGISRSKFHFAPCNTGSFKAGKLVPFYFDADVLPGSTYKVDLRCLVRGSTPVAVPMDNSYLDVYYFFVPNKILLSRQSMSPSVNDGNHSWASFVGAQDGLLNMPLPSEDRKLPSFAIGEGVEGPNEPAVGGLWDWTGQTMDPISGIIDVNPLPFLAYFKVWNDFFRDPNGSMNPVTFSISGGNVYLSGGVSSMSLPSTPAIRSVKLAPVCRYHGYFGSALPWPQRNSTMVSLPLGDQAPLLVNGSYKMAKGSDFVDGTSSSIMVAGNVVGNTGTQTGISYNSIYNQSNLWADLSQCAGVTVNQFRLLVQEQRWFEALARSGNNTLAELTAGMFNVTPSDAVADRAQLLGCKRIPLNIIQVNNTAGNNVSSSTQSSLGSTGSFSLTNSDDFIFSKSFDTWGVIIGVACVRTDDTFHQGVEKMYTRLKPFDYYWPQFANLGEQPVYNREILASGGETDDKVFGYQEAYAEYRFRQNHVCGLLRPSQSLGYWTYANDFSFVPTLNDFLDASNEAANIDRTLQVWSTKSGFQFIGQFVTDVTAVLPMPTYSIPGLVDHH